MDLKNEPGAHSAKNLVCFYFVSSSVLPPAVAVVAATSVSCDGTSCRGEPEKTYRSRKIKEEQHMQPTSARNGGEEEGGSRLSLGRKSLPAAVASAATSSSVVTKKIRNRNKKEIKK